MTKTTTPDPKALQAVLDEANDQLDQPPLEEGTAEHKHFLGLLDTIAQSRSDILAGSSAEEQALAKHLKAFEARMPPHYQTHWHTLVSDI
jgi:hypothetical protein